jgi:hypothetical protein
MNSVPPDRAHFEQTSPLETLVRRASSRAVTPLVVRTADYNTSQQEEDERHQSPFTTPPKQKYQGRPPSSPLLHTHFRGSTATALTAYDTSYSDTTGGLTGQDHGDPSRESVYHDEESIYSRQSNAWSGLPSRQDAEPFTSDRHPNAYSQASEFDVDDFAAQYRDSYQMPSQSRGTAGAPSFIPTVVVSEPTGIYHGQHGSPPSLAANRSPVNYSRPLRPAASAESIRPPLPPVTSNDSKRQVLDRNINRFQPSTPRTGASRSPSPSHSNTNYTPSSPRTGYTTSPASVSSTSLTPSLPSRSPSPSMIAGTQTVTLPNRPPSFVQGSPTSLYSHYSYYDLDKAKPSGASGDPGSSGYQQTDMLRPGPYQSSKSRSASPSSIPTQPSTPKQGPQDFLQLGIQCHEANELHESARYFEMSAKEQGGCGVGMLMWGLTLRHGWGIQKDEKKAFKWLKRAAENAVGDLESMRGGMEATAVKASALPLGRQRSTKPSSCSPS